MKYRWILFKHRILKYFAKMKKNRNTSRHSFLFKFKMLPASFFIILLLNFTGIAIMMLHANDVYYTLEEISFESYLGIFIVFISLILLGITIIVKKEEKDNYGYIFKSISIVLYAVLVCLSLYGSLVTRVSVPPIDNLDQAAISILLHNYHTIKEIGINIQIISTGILFVWSLINYIVYLFKKEDMVKKQPISMEEPYF